MSVESLASRSNVILARLDEAEDAARWAASEQTAILLPQAIFKAFEVVMHGHQTLESGLFKCRSSSFLYTGSLLP